MRGRDVRTGSSLTDGTLVSQAVNDHTLILPTRLLKPFIHTIANARLPRACSALTSCMIEVLIPIGTAQPFEKLSYIYFAVGRQRDVVTGLVILSDIYWGSGSSSGLLHAVHRYRHDRGSVAKSTTTQHLLQLTPAPFTNSLTSLT